MKGKLLIITDSVMTDEASHITCVIDDVVFPPDKPHIAMYKPHYIEFSRMDMMVNLLATALLLHVIDDSVNWKIVLECDFTYWYIKLIYRNVDCTLTIQTRSFSLPADVYKLVEEALYILNRNIVHDGMPPLDLSVFTKDNVISIKE